MPHGKLWQGPHVTWRCVESGTRTEGQSVACPLQGYRKMHAHQRRMLDEQLPSGLGYTPTTDLEEFAAWLARRMPHLHMLSLFVGACPALPALSQLRHIEIQAGCMTPSCLWTIAAV